MFSHVLLPTDGSALSETANLEGIRLAKRSNLKVTGIDVMSEFHLSRLLRCLADFLLSIFVNQRLTDAGHYVFGSLGVRRCSAAARVERGRPIS